MNGVGAKLESKPSSLRLERMTSPGPAACGRISHAGAPSGDTGCHQCAGYWLVESQAVSAMTIKRRKHFRMVQVSSKKDGMSPYKYIGCHAAERPEYASFLRTNGQRVAAQSAPGPGHHLRGQGFESAETG